LSRVLGVRRITGPPEVEQGITALKTRRKKEGVSGVAFIERAACR
jgi:hypothetical protein